MRRLPIILGALAVVLIIALSSIFIVDERKQALVLQFGEVRQVRTEPGVGLKMPLVQNVIYYEGRILPLDTEPLEVTPLDERRLVVDAFARWRIVDPVEFRQAVRTEAAAEQRLERILNASLREVLGSVPSQDVLSPERSVLMGRIRDAARQEAEGLGVEIIDVRIRRADLPEQNLNATFERMEAERQREAADERARGKERAQEIRATADRQAVELVSAAEREAAIVRGEADAERNEIYAGAYGRDEEFFSFYRSLEAYERALRGENSTMVITPDSAFFEYLASPGVAEPQAVLDGPAAALPAPVIEPEARPAQGRKTVEELEAEVIGSEEEPRVLEEVDRLEAEVIGPEGIGGLEEADPNEDGAAATGTSPAPALVTPDAETTPPGATSPAPTLATEPAAAEDPAAEDPATEIPEAEIPEADGTVPDGDVPVGDIPDGDGLDATVPDGTVPREPVPEEGATSPLR